MTADELRATVLRLLGNLAPEADLAGLPPTRNLRDELDLDSMDFLHFVTAVHDTLGIDVPERDYPELATLEKCVDYLRARVT